MQETVIAADTRVDGHLAGQLVRVFGQVTGNIDAGEVIIESGAQVGGGIVATGVRVLGRVEGPIRAERVIVESTGQSLGGIAAPSVSLAEGCTIQGRLDSNLPGPAPGFHAPHASPAPQMVTSYTQPNPLADSDHRYASNVPQSSAPAVTPTPTVAASALPVTEHTTTPPTSAPKTASTGLEKIFNFAEANCSKIFLFGKHPSGHEIDKLKL